MEIGMPVAAAWYARAISDKTDKISMELILGFP